jgi:hypothetical protein
MLLMSGLCRIFQILTMPYRVQAIIAADGWYTKQAFLPSPRSGGLKDGELDYISQINISRSLSYCSLNSFLDHFLAKSSSSRSFIISIAISFNKTLSHI